MGGNVAVPDAGAETPAIRAILERIDIDPDEYKGKDGSNSARKRKLQADDAYQGDANRSVKVSQGYSLEAEINYNKGYGATDISVVSCHTAGVAVAKAFSSLLQGNGIARFDFALGVTVDKDANIVLNTILPIAALLKELGGGDDGEEKTREILFIEDLPALNDTHIQGQRFLFAHKMLALLFSGHTETNEVLSIMNNLLEAGTAVTSEVWTPCVGNGVNAGEKGKGCSFCISIRHILEKYPDDPAHPEYGAAKADLLKQSEIAKFALEVVFHICKAEARRRRRR